MSRKNVLSQIGRIRLNPAVALIVAVLWFGVVWHLLSETSPAASTTKSTSNSTPNPGSVVGEVKHTKALRMVLDIVGARPTPLSKQAAAAVDETVSVIGVLIQGQPIAFVQDAMRNTHTHVVNVVVNGTPVSATFCNMANSTRVLTTENSIGDPIDLRVGGLDFDNQMVLLFEDIRYGQSSHELPLVDLGFELTTLADWKSRHQATQLYRP